MDVYEEADLYSAAFAWPLGDEVEWLLRIANGPRSVLEPFCGNARYATEFVRRGVEYHGVDLSRAMLDRAPKHPRIHLHEGDVRSIRIPGLVADLAWCPVNSIRHLLSDEDVLRHLATVREHLAPEGRYVVELELVRWDGAWTWKPEHGGVWSEPQPDGAVVEARWMRERCDLASRTCRERATFRRLVDGRVREEATHVFTMRMWTHGDLLRLVEDAGLRIERTWLRDDDGGRRETQPSADAENTGENRYYVLARSSRSTSLRSNGPRG